MIPNITLLPIEISHKYTYIYTSYIQYKNNCLGNAKKTIFSLITIIIVIFSGMKKNNTNWKHAVNVDQ